MIQSLTLLNVCDNSGVKSVKNLKNKVFKIGNLILTSVKNLRPINRQKKIE